MQLQNKFTENLELEVNLELFLEFDLEINPEIIPDSETILEIV